MSPASRTPQRELIAGALFLIHAATPCRGQQPAPNLSRAFLGHTITLVPVILSHLSQFLKDIWQFSCKGDRHDGAVNDCC